MKFSVGDVVDMECALTGGGIDKPMRKVSTKTFIVVGHSRDSDGEGRVFFCRIGCNRPFVYSVKQKDLHGLNARKNLAKWMQSRVESKQNGD